VAAPIPLGRIDWYENLTTDLDAAIAFYTQLLGWTITNWGEGPDPYRMWTNRGTPLGGVLQLPDAARNMGAPPHWMMYVTVPDVDASVEQARALGATAYVAPTDITQVGRFAVLADPEDAPVAVIRPEQLRPPRRGRPRVGEFSWHELAARDHIRAFQFYHALFGWQKGEAHEMGPLGTYQGFRRAGAKRDMGGMYTKPKDMPNAAWQLYIRVADLDAAVAKLSWLGGRVLRPPMEVPGGDRVAECVDSCGAHFALHWMRAV
jgi:predicted enzyme related to lactoylglutathione lyase